MSQPIAYTVEENLLRIKMDRNTKYLVVEGVDDIPKYECSLRSITNTVDFEPIHVGGKVAINKLVGECTSDNFIAIVDKDFDLPSLSVDERILVLGKYSIENYTFSMDILVPLLASTLNQTEATVKGWFSLDEWSAHVFNECRLLLRLFHYYQTIYTGDRQGWSKSFLLDGNDWSINKEKVEAVINNLLGNSIELDTVKGHQDFIGLDKIGFLAVFPGKMLMTSIYRYLKNKVKETYGNCKAFARKVQGELTFNLLSSNNLHRSSEFKNDMIKAIAFLTAAHSNNC